MGYKAVDYLEGVLDAVCRVRGVSADGSDDQRRKGEDLIYAAFARPLLSGHPAFHKMYWDRVHPVKDDTMIGGEKQINTVRLPAQYSYMKPVADNG